MDTLSYDTLVKLETVLFRAMEKAYRQEKHALGDALHSAYWDVRNAQYAAYIREFDEHFKKSVVYTKL